MADFSDVSIDLFCSTALTICLALLGHFKVRGWKKTQQKEEAEANKNQVLSPFVFIY